MLLNDHVTIISVANTDLLFMNGEQIKNALNNERLAAEIGKKANAEIIVLVNSSGVFARQAQQAAGLINQQYIANIGINYKLTFTI